LFGKRLHPFSVRLQNGVTSQISTQTESPANFYPKKSQNKVLRIKESNS
jgi:hypothetical protein